MECLGQRKKRVEARCEDLRGVNMINRFYQVFVVDNQNFTYDVKFHQELVFKDVPYDTVERYIKCLEEQKEFNYEVNYS